MDTLNEILIECAKLRGCYPLMHRTLHQFNWFVGVLVFGWTEYDKARMVHDSEVDGCHDQFWTDMKAEYERIHERWYNAYTCSENDLINEARAFLEYCQEEYGEEVDRAKLVSEISGITDPDCAYYSPHYNKHMPGFCSIAKKHGKPYPYCDASLGQCNIRDLEIQKIGAQNTLKSPVSTK